MIQEHIYDITVKWNSERKGTLSSSVLNDTIQVATPPEFPKGIPGVWSPEYLFVASVNSCLMTTFLSIAENSNLGFIDFESKAFGKLELIDKKYIISEITLYPVVTIKNDSERDKAVRILEKAEAACFITNSIKSNIILSAEVRIKA